MSLKNKTLEELNNIEFELVKSLGGYINITEFDQWINDVQIAKIKAFARQNKECWLGSIKRDKVALTRYEGQQIYNFQYTFIVPSNDIDLINLINNYNMRYEMLNKIIDKVYELEGCSLFWV